VRQWLVPWLVGLAVLSYLGNFPEQSAGAGNLGVLNFEWAIVLLLALSVAVHAIAFRFRLSPEEAAEHIELSRAESAVEEGSSGRVSDRPRAGHQLVRPARAGNGCRPSRTTYARPPDPRMPPCAGYLFSQALSNCPRA
jgi:hypothetical protein